MRIKSSKLNKISPISRGKPTIAIIGIGRWGKKLLTAFSKLTKVAACCYRGSKENEKWLKENYPKIRLTPSYREILNDESVDAVVIATPIAAHYSLAKQALLAGKHVFVEKPIAQTVSEARELIRLARKQKLILFVGHIFLYHPVFRKLQEVAKNDPPVFAEFRWDKWGTFDEDILLNLAPHDVATALAMFGARPRAELIEKRRIFTPADVVTIRLSFPQKRSAIISINRASPRTAKSAAIITHSGKTYFWKQEVLYRITASGPKAIYRAKKGPLDIECRAFLESIRDRKPAPTNGKFGTEVLKVLSQLDRRSLS